tara:strand:+ start:1003 stop:1740 length:738 start_codon:yes stop_codon:yes gene_type:complete
MDFTVLLIFITFISGIFFLLSKLDNFSNTFFSLLHFIGSLFPILFIVLFIRSFIIEPYKIPSGSMIPTLLIGDFILVKKYQYGIRVPIINQVIFENNKPDYGDIVVFQYPQNKKINYIKRVIALPGDSIRYLDKELFVNGKKYTQTQEIMYPTSSQYNSDNVYKEANSSKSYNILKSTNPSQDFEYTVPAGTYFVLGDNRDNSNDSRYWGPVPFENLIGEAFYIWMYWNPSGSDTIINRIGITLD